MTIPADLQRLSKFLSFVLRHKPSAAGIMLDVESWVGVDELLRGLRGLMSKRTENLCNTNRQKF